MLQSRLLTTIFYYHGCAKAESEGKWTCPMASQPYRNNSRNSLPSYTCFVASVPLHLRGRNPRWITPSTWAWMLSLISPFGLQFSSGQLLSHVRLLATLWTAACQASLSITDSWSSLKLMSIESVMPSNNLILCRPLFLLPSIFPRIRVFSNESKYWSFSFSISPSNEHPGLISFRMDWLDLLAVQGTLKSLLQHHSSKALIFWHSAFFIVQPSHPYMTTGKTIALTRWTFVDKVMSLLFNMLSRLVIAFLPRSKRL